MVVINVNAGAVVYSCETYQFQKTVLRGTYVVVENNRTLQEPGGWFARVRFVVRSQANQGPDDN